MEINSVDVVCSPCGSRPANADGWGCGDCGDGAVAWVSYPNGDQQRTFVRFGRRKIGQENQTASSDPFVRNFFVCTESLAESNPVPQDPISAIHPPCIYAGDVASAMGFALCRSKMMNEVVALHSPPMRKDAAEKNGTLFRSVGCVGSRELFTLKFKHPCHPEIRNSSFQVFVEQDIARFHVPVDNVWSAVVVKEGQSPCSSYGNFPSCSPIKLHSVLPPVSQNIL
nr:cytochrome C maturation protein CcmFN [Ipomoea batatas]